MTGFSHTPPPVPAVEGGPLRCLAPLRPRNPVADIPAASRRCRRCSNCLRVRGNQWMRRMHRELQFARSSWFVTLTYRRPTGLIPADVLTHSLNKWIKRLRYFAARRGASLRYISVAESASSGARGQENFHWHLVCHFSKPVVYRTFPKWSFGFSHRKKLVNQSRASIVGYLAKYLFKAPPSALPVGKTVRASNYFGDALLAGQDTKPDGFVRRDSIRAGYDAERQKQAYRFLLAPRGGRGWRDLLADLFSVQSRAPPLLL